MSWTNWEIVISSMRVEELSIGVELAISQTHGVYVRTGHML